MKKKTLLILLCLSLTCGSSMAFADESDNSERISEIESEISELQNQINELEGELNGLLGDSNVAADGTTYVSDIIVKTDEDGFSENVKCTVYQNTLTQQIMMKFENNNDSTAFIEKVNFSFYDEDGELIDAKSLGSVFVNPHSVNYGEMVYSDEYASADATAYIYEDEEQFDYTDFDTTEIFEDDYMRLIITNSGDQKASAMPTIIYYKDDELFYVAPDIGETALNAGDSEETDADTPKDADWNQLDYDSYEIIMLGYSY